MPARAGRQCGGEPFAPARDPFGARIDAVEAALAGDPHPAVDVFGKVEDRVVAERIWVVEVAPELSRLARAQVDQRQAAATRADPEPAAAIELEGPYCCLRVQQGLAIGAEQRQEVPRRVIAHGDAAAVRADKEPPVGIARQR